MDKKLKNNLIVVGFGVTLFVALYRLDAIGGALKSLFHIVEPVLAGCLIAFVLNVPMGKVDGWLHRLTRKARRQPSPAALQVVSLILTLALVIGIFVLLAFAAIPPLVSSVTEAATTIQTNIPNWQQKLQDLGIDAEWIDSAYNALRNKLQSSALSGGACDCPTLDRHRTQAGGALIANRLKQTNIALSCAACETRDVGLLP